LPLWRADSVWQIYLPGTNVVMPAARFGAVRVVVKGAVTAGALAMTMRAWPRGGRSATPRVAVNIERPARCREVREERGLGLVCGANGGQLNRNPDQTLAAAARRDRRWLARARQLGPGAPAWARRLYERSLLTLRALTDIRSGASVAGARDGWAYVWPRDTATAALAFNAAGYRREAQKISRFLLSLDLGAAARFYSNGEPVPGRGAQGDAFGWVAVAERSLGRLRGGLAGPSPLLSGETSPESWQDLPDYQEGEPGNYLGNALATGEPAIHYLYGGKSQARLLREPEDPDSGLDSAAAWAVEPFGLRRLYPAARETMLRLARRGGRYGITPGTAWPGEDPWTAPTAWTAWSLTTLSRQERDPVRARVDRRVALHLLADLRRAAAPDGALPERVDAQTGVPRSTTPLAWSHAFAILALLELWPPQTKR
jgi:hypothetical protein